MDELTRMGITQHEDFFDDGDNGTIGRMETGEDPEDYGVREVSQAELAQQAQEEERDRQSRLNDRQVDFRMEGRGLPPTHGSGYADAAPPKSLRMGSHNTGPKGVKRDYDEAKKNAKINRVFGEMRRERELRSMATGIQQFQINDTNAGIESVQNINEEDRIRDYERKKRIHQSQNSKNKDDVWSDEESSQDSDSDDERLFAKFRENRIREIHASLPVFGGYVRVQSVTELASIINQNHEYTWVVVHMYQNTNRCCLSLHLTFENLATQFPHVCFLRIRSNEASSTYNEEGLPTLLLYQGSQLKHSLIAVARMLGAEPSDKSVAQMLADKGVLKVPTGGLEEIKYKDKKKWLDGYESENDEDYNGNYRIREGKQSYMKETKEEEEEEDGYGRGGRGGGGGMINMGTGTRGYGRDDDDDDSFDWSD